MSEVYCNNCGHRNPAGSNFCSSCGAVLETDAGEPTTITFFPTEAADPVDEEVSVNLDDQGSEHGTLVVKRGPNAGSRYTLPGDLIRIGRHPDSDIFLDDITVSRQHVEITRAGGEYRLADAGSLNGTYLNRERIEEPTVLRHGDEVQVGKFKLYFVQGQGTTE